MFKRCVQAAAHGVPTVATKNGGPVDIMATLHHGLLVDPTNSKQIADALLKILTNPEVWDEMSHNGTPTPACHLLFNALVTAVCAGKHQLSCCASCMLHPSWLPRV